MVLRHGYISGHGVTATETLPSAEFQNFKLHASSFQDYQGEGYTAGDGYFLTLHSKEIGITLVLNLDHELNMNLVIDSTARLCGKKRSYDRLFIYNARSMQVLLCDSL